VAEKMPETSDAVPLIGWVAPNCRLGRSTDC
jgi:hypothetical protein